MCNNPECPISSQKLVDGKMVSTSEATPPMVAVWKETVDPDYQSPYGNRRLAAGNFTRELQMAGTKLMESSIVCIK